MSNREKERRLDFFLSLHHLEAPKDTSLNEQFVKDNRIEYVVIDKGHGKEECIFIQGRMHKMSFRGLPALKRQYDEWRKKHE